MDEHDTYTLRETTSGWDLRLNGERLSLFETFFEAERTALNAAEVSRRGGKVVEVYVQTASGTIDLIHKGNPAPLPAPRKIIGYHAPCNVELVGSADVRRGSLVAGPEEAA
jgi:hypothetical protein